MILIIHSAAMILCTAKVSGPMVEFKRREPLVGRKCGTCGAVFATRDALWAHLIGQYHGFQCLRCGTLYAGRGDHICARTLRETEASDLAARGRSSSSTTT
jgi:uncharacterized OB-fold protein